MRSVRYEIEVKDGVKVPMLFTPHLYSFKGTQGVDFQRRDGELTNAETFEVYADIMFCAALNAWVLDGHGGVEEFPATRGDFHAFMIERPKDYGKALSFAVEALTGKRLKELVEDAKKDPANLKVPDAPEGKKKVRSTLTGKLAKLFSSANVE